VKVPVARQIVLGGRQPAADLLGLTQPRHVERASQPFPVRFQLRGATARDLGRGPGRRIRGDREPTHQTAEDADRLGERRLAQGSSKAFKQHGAAVRVSFQQSHHAAAVPPAQSMDLFGNVRTGRRHPKGQRFTLATHRENDRVGSVGELAVEPQLPPLALTLNGRWQ